MQTGWKIGSILGIPLLIDPSWFIILGFFTLINGAAWENRYPEWGAGVAWGAGLAISLLLFVSVLLHELGHSLVARSQGIKVNSITLFLFGGIASIDQESKSPGLAFQVAIAGPLVSLSLFVFLTLLSQLWQFPAPVSAIAENLAYINLVLALFNMIPGLPLDGGQVLKALVWKITGSRFQGVRWAANSGRLLGWAAIALGVTTYLTSRSLDFVWIALLGWFGVRYANAYDRLANLQEALVQLNAGDAMTRDFRVLDANITLREFADEYLLAETKPAVYFAAADGRYRGLVPVDALRVVERSLWEIQTLNHIVQPLTQISAVEEKACLAAVVNTLEIEQLRRITVLSPAGAVAGIIDRGDIVRALTKYLKMPVSEEAIARIKEEGTYPPGLQLGAIAKTTLES